MSNGSSGSEHLRVVVIGSAGRMGAFACNLVRETPAFELIGAYDVDDDWQAQLGHTDARVGLDFTRAGLGLEHGLALLEAGVRPVIGTSGMDPADDAALDSRARELGLGGLVVPNFSIGIWLLQRACEEIAGHFPDAEVLELHHPGKLDSPSGTALDTARRIAGARRAQPGGEISGAARGQACDRVAVHSVRLPGMYAHQEVLFGAAGESLSLRHDMHSPEAFTPGILAACRYAATATGVERGIGVALSGA